jgi:hypothetical protein
MKLSFRTYTLLVATFRWFIPKHNDQYTVLIKDFGPAFIDEFIKKRDNTSEYSFLRDPDTAIVSTGHSLGGGLDCRVCVSVL